ncbi:hypothetical protein Bbelb_007720 [Branchiostoma belcheri]|nr:hypothetical protein Bbelb_007720 [Branchiostoma belcheri]
MANDGCVKITSHIKRAGKFAGPGPVTARHPEKGRGCPQGLRHFLRYISVSPGSLVFIKPSGVPSHHHSYRVPPLREKMGRLGSVEMAMAGVVGRSRRDTAGLIFCLLHRDVIKRREVVRETPHQLGEPEFRPYCRLTVVINSENFGLAFS